MSYTRTLKDGTAKRFYTPREIAVQKTRRDNAPTYADRRYIRGQFRKNRVSLQLTYSLQYRTFRDLLNWYSDAQRNVWDWQKHIQADLRLKYTKVYTDDCSVGGLDNAREMLNICQYELLFIAAVIRLYYRTYRIQE